jgi:hypothetical protein
MFCVSCLSRASELFLLLCFPDLRKEVRKAKLELKKSKRKDYYKILGVAKNADESAISKAFKKAARVCICLFVTLVLASSFAIVNHL